MDVRGVLRRALSELEREKAQIERQINSLRLALNGAGQRGGRRRGSHMSKAARLAASRRMKAYWAKRRKLAAARNKGA